MILVGCGSEGSMPGLPDAGATLGDAASVDAASISTPDASTAAVDASPDAVASPDATSSFVVQVTKVGAGAGLLTSSDTALDCGAVCSVSVLAGASVAVEVTPALGSAFVSWGGACTGEATQVCSLVNVQENIDVGVEFSLDQHTVAVSSSGCGQGTVTSTDGNIDCGISCESFYDFGSPVSLLATPTNAATFAGWDVACSGTSSTCDLVVAQDLSARANFSSPAWQHVWSEPTGTVAIDMHGGMSITNSGAWLPRFHLDVSGSGSANISHFDLATGQESIAHSFGTNAFIGGISHDPDENLYLAGAFEQGISFGGSTFTAGNFKEIYVAKLASDGTHLWSRHYPPETLDNGNDGATVAGIIDDTDPIIFGSISDSGAVNFGGGSIVGSYIVRLSGTDGSHVWTRTMPSCRRVRPVGSELVTLCQAAAAVDYGDGITYPTRSVSVLWLSASDGSIVRRYDLVGGTGASVLGGRDLAVASDGSVLTTIDFRGTVSFSAGSATSVPTNRQDILFLRLDAGGALLWSRQLGGELNEVSHSIGTFGSSEGLLSLLSTSSILDVGCETIAPSALGENFVLRFDLDDGSTSGIESTGSARIEQLGSLGTSTFASGRLFDTADLGGGTLQSAGDGDVFMGRFSSP